MTHPYFQRTSGVRVFAHRGLVTPEDAAAGIAENSLAAVAAAHAAGATFVELDTHLTSDGVAVIFHDAKLERVTGDDRRVRDVTAAELRDIMEPRGGLITLEELLAAFPTVRFNIDVKVPEVAEPAGRLIAPHADRVLIAGFDDTTRRRALQAAHAAGGDPATSAGRSLITPALLAARTGARRRAARLLSDVDAIQIPMKAGPLTVFTPRLIEAAHDAGVEVHVWTINEVDTMRRLVTAGADGIVTDRADLALRAFT